MIGIAGESGCGKTTFLKIISKQIHLDSMVNDAVSMFYGNQDALLKKDLTIAQQFELIESIYNREHDQNTIDVLFNNLNIKANLLIIRKEQHRQSHKVHHLYHQLHH